MAGYRSPTEREALQAEAERRVRAGEARSEVARSLGVPLNTVSVWALDGGWRRKDIEAERADATVETTQQRIEDASRQSQALAFGSAPSVAEAGADPEERGAADAEVDPQAAARACLALAARLTRRERVREAEAAQRMAERFQRMATAASGSGTVAELQEKIAELETKLQNADWTVNKAWGMLVYTVADMEHIRNGTWMDTRWWVQCALRKGIPMPDALVMMIQKRNSELDARLTVKGWVDFHDPSPERLARIAKLEAELRFLEAADWREAEERGLKLWPPAERFEAPAAPAAEQEAGP